MRNSDSQSLSKNLQIKKGRGADAIFTYYLGAKTNRIIEIDMTPTPIYDDIPAGEPIFKNDTSAI